VISREIRRARNKLANLEKLRDAARVVGRHKNLVHQLVNEAGRVTTGDVVAKFGLHRTTAENFRRYM